MRLLDCFFLYLFFLSSWGPCSCCGSSSKPHSCNERSNLRHQILLFEPVRVEWRPCAIIVFTNAWPIHIKFHRVDPCRSLNSLFEYSAIVPSLKNVEGKDFISYHFYLSFSFWRDFIVNKSRLLLLYFICNFLPLLLEFQTLLIIFKTPRIFFFRNFRAKRSYELSQKYSTRKCVYHLI